MLKVELNILEDVKIADSHPWVGVWKLKKGDICKVTKNVADRLISRGQAEFSDSEKALQKDRGKSSVNGRGRNKPNNSKKSGIPDAIKNKLG